MQLPSVWLLIAALVLVVLLINFFFVQNTMPRKVFNCLSPANTAARGQRILLLIPHPDDESLAVGGYINMCRHNGAEMRLILVSDGNYRNLRELRYQEFKAASKELGISESDLRFWGFPDGALKLYHEAIVTQVEQEIGEYRPELIIYPHPDDKHRDHSILGRSVEQALVKADRLDIPAYAYLIHYNFYQLPACFSKSLFPPRSMPDNNADWRLVSLTPQAQRAKRSALLKYHSQRRNPFLQPLFLVSLRNNELLCRRRIVPQS